MLSSLRLVLVFLILSLSFSLFSLTFCVPLVMLVIAPLVPRSSHSVLLIFYLFYGKLVSFFFFLSYLLSHIVYVIFLIVCTILKHVIKS